MKLFSKIFNISLWVIATLLTFGIAMYALVNSSLNEYVCQWAWCLPAIATIVASINTVVNKVVKNVQTKKATNNNELLKK